MPVVSTDRTIKSGQGSALSLRLRGRNPGVTSPGSVTSMLGGGGPSHGTALTGFPWRTVSAHVCRIRDTSHESGAKHLLMACSAHGYLIS